MKEAGIWDGHAAWISPQYQYLNQKTNFHKIQFKDDIWEHFKAVLSTISVGDNNTPNVRICEASAILVLFLYPELMYGKNLQKYATFVREIFLQNAK